MARPRKTVTDGTQSIPASVTVTIPIAPIEAGVLMAKPKQVVEPDPPGKPIEVKLVGRVPDNVVTIPAEAALILLSRALRAREIRSNVPQMLDSEDGASWSVGEDDQGAPYLVRETGMRQAAEDTQTHRDLVSKQNRHETRIAQILRRIDDAPEEAKALKPELDAAESALKGVQASIQTLLARAQNLPKQERQDFPRGLTGVKITLSW